jgi:hypothetical protein
MNEMAVSLLGETWKTRRSKEEEDSEARSESKQRRLVSKGRPHVMVR